MSGRVLVVDADAVTRRQAIVALMPAGYEVHIAEDAFGALTAAMREEPSLVLLGDSMTDQPGLALIGRLFSAPETAELPVLVIADSPEKRAAADAAGARRVLDGPVTTADLVAAVAHEIERPGALPQAPDSVLRDEARLAAVEALKPGPSGDPSLDRFTELTARMLGSSASTITLLDHDKQIWASQSGLDEPWASAGVTPLEYSYCQFAVTSRQPLRIDDARAHPLVSGSPAIDAGAIAYMGIPLITPDGQAVGTLCAIDGEPRRWTDQEAELLGDLAEVLTEQLVGTRSGGGRHRSA